MKFTLAHNAAVCLLAVSAAVVSSGQLHAGWGVLRGGSSGGSTGYASLGGASSGGYAAAYGSSGYAAAYGSSGYAAAYGSSGSYAAYSSLGGSSGGSSGAAVYGGSTGRPGLLQRLASHIHDHWDAKRARHAARHAGYGSSGGYASSGAYYGSSGYASSGGSSGGYGVSYGSSGGAVSYGSSGAAVSYGSAGGVYHGASNTQADVSSLASSTQDDSVFLTVSVPANAKVFVNDDLTTSTGTVRKFVSHGLQSGKQYRFVVRAELATSDGQQLTEEKTVVVSAGGQQNMQFAFADSHTPIETAITLNLPAEAKVRLAGNETKATGDTRVFRTSRLAVGELWDDYQIEVEYQGEVKQQTVRLVGGDNLQLTFDFDSQVANLASR